MPPTGSEVIGGSMYSQQIPLTNLQPATAYELHVRASNRHGWGRASHTFHFSTLARGEGELLLQKVQSGAVETGVVTTRSEITFLMKQHRQCKVCFPYGCEQIIPHKYTLQ